MADDPNKAAWYFWVKCRKCGSKALAFRDPSRGRLRQVGDGEYTITCGNCGHAGIYSATELRSGPAAPEPTPPNVA
jgi:ribosomal protein S27E